MELKKQQDSWDDWAPASLTVTKEKKKERGDKKQLLIFKVPDCLPLWKKKKNNEQSNGELDGLSHEICDESAGSQKRKKKLTSVTWFMSRENFPF